MIGLPAVVGWLVSIGIPATTILPLMMETASEKNAREERKKERGERNKLAQLQISADQTEYLRDLEKSERSERRRLAATERQLEGERQNRSVLQQLALSGARTGQVAQFLGGNYGAAMGQPNNAPQIGMEQLAQMGMGGQQDPYEALGIY